MQSCPILKKKEDIATAIAKTEQQIQVKGKDVHVWDVFLTQDTKVVYITGGSSNSFRADLKCVFALLRQP